MSYEDVSQDPGVEEAILNIQTAIRRVAACIESTRRAFPFSGLPEELSDAQAELEQAVRFLTGEETPS
jgi:hypothetical protein